jgi:hypothetical protein
VGAGRDARPAQLGAAAGLVVLRTQRKRHRRRAQSRNPRDLAARTMRDAVREARKVLDDLAPGG